MNNMQVGGRPITVESARAAKEATTGSDQPFSMLQLHQLAQVMATSASACTLSSSCIND